MSADHRSAFSGRPDLPWSHGHVVDGVSRRDTGRPVAVASSERRLRPVTARPRPVHPGDAAQARLFADILRAEIDEFEMLAEATEARWRRRQHTGMEGDPPPEALTRMRMRIKEVQLMLDALLARFPMIVTETDI